MIPCWCGNTFLKPFSPSYRHCKRCQTLVSQEWFTPKMTEVANDAQDFYGKEYWLSHQAQDLGFPDIYSRARTDLPERCLYWLRTLLKYKLPPASTLELGGAHGGSVAMLAWAGFDATNLELSPWVVEFSRQTFNVPSLLGPIEDQTIAPASLDVIAMMDVFEHLPDPLATIRHCLPLLKPDGIFLIQTPQFPEQLTYQQMQAEDHRFLEQFKQDEHLYLFSQPAITQFFQQLNVPYLIFEPAIFAHYDMFLVASRQPLSEHGEDVISTALCQTAVGRLIQALLDIDTQKNDLFSRYTSVEQNRAAQIERVQLLEKQVKAVETQSQRQAEAIQHLQHRAEVLETALKDQTAQARQQLKAHQGIEQQWRQQQQGLEQQLNALNTQRQSLTQQLKTSEQNREHQVSTLQASIQQLQQSDQTLRQQLSQVTTTRQTLTDQLTHLNARFEQAEANRHLVTEALLAVSRSRTHHILERLGRWKWINATLAQALPARSDSQPARPPAVSPASNETIGTKKMRVVVDLTPLLPGGENGGAKIMTLELMQQLSQSAPELEFILLTTDKNHDELEFLDAANVSRRCLTHANRLAARRQNLSVKWQQRAQEQLKRILPATVVSRLKQYYRSVPIQPPRSSLLHSLKADLLFCPFTAPLHYDPMVPVVSVIYDLQYLYYPEFFSAEDRIVRDQNFRSACRLAQHITCISDYVRETVLEQSDLQPDQVTTVHIQLGQRLDRASSALNTGMLDSYGLQSEQFLLYPANFWAHKNHEMLLTAFAMYLARHPDSPLKLVCTGTPNAQMHRIQDAAKRMGLADRVAFPGYLSDGDFRILLQESLALIFPSLYEGFGMPLLEAMALDKPVLCSNVTSLPEIAGDAALLFDPRKPTEIINAIERITSDDALRTQLIQRGAQRLPELGNPERMAEQYLQVFREILHTPRPPGMHGIYEDGWTSDHVILSYDAHDMGAARTLELDLSVPPFTPHEHVTVQVLHVEEGRTSTYTIPRHQTLTIRESLPAHRGSVELWIDPVFDPKTVLQSRDQRLLGCLCKGWQIRELQDSANPQTTVSI